MSSCSTTPRDLCVIPGHQLRDRLADHAALLGVEAAQDRLHTVLDPLQPLLQLDDLLGHPGELGPGGEVEVHQHLVQRLLTGLLGGCLRGQHLLQRAAHHLGEALGVHGLAEHARPRLDPLIEELLPLADQIGTGRGLREHAGPVLEPLVEHGRQKATGSGGAAGGVIWDTSLVQAWVDSSSWRFHVSNSCVVGSLMPPLPSGAPATPRPWASSATPRRDRRSARCGRRAARCSPFRGCSPRR